MNELLKKLPYWSSLSDDEKQLVESAAILRRYPKGALLSEPCEDCLGMTHILRGEIRAYIMSDEGREVTLFHLSPGENCVLSASCVIRQISFDTHMAVTEDADVLIVPSSVFGKLCEQNIYVRCFMYELATRRFSSVMFVMQQILFARLDQRLAAFLLSEYRSSGCAEIRMTQEQIARHVNSAREVIARMLKRFAADGLIETYRGMILLKDIDGLEALRR